LSDFSPETPLSSVLWQERKTMFGALGASILIGAAYTLLVPAVWEASSTIVFPVKSPSILGATSFSDAASGLAALTGGATPLRIYEGFLDSQRTREFVGERTGKKPREIKDMTQVVDQMAESSLTISARDRDPALAKRVVALHLDALVQINRDLSDPLSSDDSRAIGAQLMKEKAKLRASESRLLEFQRQAKTAPSVATAGSGKDSAIMPAGSRWDEMLKGLEIDKQRVDAALGSARRRLGVVSQAGGALPVESEAVARWRDRLAQAQYNLQTALLTLSPESPEVDKLQKTILIAKERLAVEVQNYVRAVDIGVLSASEKATTGLPELLLQQAGLEAQLLAVRRLAAEAPGESITLSRLTREVAMQGTVVAQLQGQYSLASLQSERDPRRWQVLDAPEVAEKPVNKSFSKNLAVAALVGLTLGSFAALIQARRRPRRAPSEEA